ncbi:MAG: DUF5011 domain-containing protein [Pseudobutyrivibrio sp.]|nr:DUF5011 domain-containing protein [Pseudobutyrivibrio sp.]
MRNIEISESTRKNVSRDSEYTRDPRVIREERLARELRQAREPYQSRDPRLVRNSRQARDPRQARDSRINPERRMMREERLARELRQARNARPTRDSRPSRDASTARDVRARNANMPARTRKSRKSKKLRRLFTLGKVALIVAVLGVGAYFYYDYSSRVYKKCEVELGTVVKPTDFLKDTSKPAKFTKSTAPKIDKVGTYTVGIQSDFYTYKCKLIVKDHVAPELEVKTVTRIPEEKPVAADFVESASDLSGEVSFHYKAEPQYDGVGSYPVIIVAEDSSGNQTEKEANLNIVSEYDVTPPVIAGQLDKTVYVGSGVGFKSGITVTDNMDTGLQVEVDSSQIDLDTPGVYTITYSATDSMGNIGTAQGTVTVIEQMYSEDQVYALADGVLKNIVNDNMSDFEKAKAIFAWVQANIGYSESSDRDDWLKGAYDGLTNHRGDCYNYYAVSKALLTRAGIKNEDIEIIPTATRHHYWNVIDCGEGWRHFDATPRVDKSFKGFYLTDDELTAYSKQHYNSHNFDRSVYHYFN